MTEFSPDPSSSDLRLSALSSPAFRRWRRLLGRPEVQVGLIALIALLAVWSIVAFNLVRSHEEVLTTAERDNRALTRTLRGHTEATLDSATQLLDRGADLIMDEGMPSDAERDIFARHMVRAVDHVEKVSGFGIFAADAQLRVAIVRDGMGGFSVVRTTLDLSDRDYTKAIVDLPGDTPFLGIPVKSRADGTWVVPISRPVRDMVGALTGGAVALIDIDTFSALFDAVRPAGRSYVSLIRESDRMLIAGAPSDIDSLGAPYQGLGAEMAIGPDGSSNIRVSPVDGATRLVTAVPVANGDLRLIVAADMRAALASWYGWRTSLILFAAAVSLAILAAAVTLAVQWRRRLASEAALGQSRQALMRSMERFERAVAGATSALWEFNLAKGGGYFAPQWEVMLGWRNIGDPYAHWRDNLHPDDRERVLAEMERHLDLHLPFDTEYRLRAADGSWRWVRARGQASWDDEGRPLVMSGMVHDVTDLHRSEERLRLALEATDEGLWDWNVQTGRLFMSARWKTLLGYAPDHPFAEQWRTFLRLARPADRRQILGWVRGLLIGSSDRRVAEFAMRRADGSWAHVRASAKITQRDGAGAASRVVGTLKDVSRRHEERAVLEQAKEQAELASRAKSEFLANMSHELRTPLNAISGFSESLESRIFGDLNDKQLEYVRDIRTSTGHLTALIGDILDMAKIESGRDELREEAVDVAAAIHGKLQMIRQRAEEKSVRLVEDVEPLPPYHLDPRKFGQMVLNLLSNAVKFTPQDGSVTVRASARADGALEVAVIDTGIGIAPEDLDKVLEPFHQVDSRLSRQYEGTGLGLPLVKAMAELHGGRLELSSVQGRGTTVTIRLPGRRRLPLGAARASAGSVL